MTDPKVLTGLLPDGWDRMPFAPFRDGVEICHLWQGGPDVALLRYAAGASVPRHRHTGLETILVLSGSQSDEAGTYPAGSLVFNPEGSEHSVWSVDGCTVLIQWERPVAFVG
ncbi:MAG: cupin domain-containing protein [Alphaproteobacteria bacterium]|nr:cupin domain-containing protein [Alphaproteobacteria bacterium]